MILSRFALARLGLLAFSMCLAACQLPGLTPPREETGKALQPCVVLALPSSGSYASIAAKIRSGATQAVQGLARSGIEVRLENIDTDKPDWLATLEGLPAQCAVVGGPLRETAYSEAKKAGTLERRVFFSFTPNLQAQDEGRMAWRFFPGPSDQIDALLHLVMDQLNIRSFGAFYPRDNYGTRMTDLLEENLAKRNLTLHKVSYDAAQPATWSAELEKVIQPTQAEGSKTPVPQTPFEAIFLPDSWRNMDMITNSLMYNGEDRLLLMGTTLWESGLAGRQVAQPHKYALAVFPVAWERNKAPAALRGENQDFWSALGYDFVNFAVASGIRSRLSAEEVTRAARNGQSAIRALAPITWDNSGVAHQALYLYQVTAGGASPLDSGRLMQARTDIMEQAALRMQGLPSGLEEEPAPPEVTPVQGPSLSPSTQPATAPVPQGQIMSTVPQSSYKLRLPVKTPGM